VLDACFETEKHKERFFFVLSIVIKNNICVYNSLEDGLSDRIIINAANDFIRNLYFTQVDRKEMTLDEYHKEYMKCMMPGYKPEGERVRTARDRISMYYKTCWKEHVDLSLAMFTAYQKGITNLMEDILAHWKDTVQGLMCQETARTLFQSSWTLYNKPFHDPQSPCLAPLLAMLLVRGPGTDQFKHWVYQATAMVLVHARNLQDDNLVSPDVLQRVLVDKLDYNCFAFST
jgi:hypothetical protein